MTFHTSLIVPLVFGLVLVIFARVITDFIFRRASGSWFDTPMRRSIFFIWTFRAVGMLTLIFVFTTMAESTDQVSLNWDRNQLQLLNNGVVKQGKVKKANYQIGAPAGWGVSYEFGAKDPETREIKTYTGGAQGPKKYYYGLSPGQEIGVIYDPCTPELNCEIRSFLNDPSFRHTFEKAGKLNLLERYKDKYEIEKYTFKEWYRQQWER